MHSLSSSYMVQNSMRGLPKRLHFQQGRARSRAGTSPPMICTTPSLLTGAGLAGSGGGTIGFSCTVVLRTGSRSFSGWLCSCTCHIDLIC